jgi:hypothetical protein
MKKTLFLLVPLFFSLDSLSQCPMPYGSDGQNSCSVDEIILTAVTLNGGSNVTHRWYTQETGGTYMTPRTSGCTDYYPCLENADPYTYVSSITVTSTISYWVSTFNSSTYCESSRKKVTATYTPNNPPTLYVGGPNDICGPDAQFYITASGGSTGSVYKWYNAPSGGTLLFTGPVYEPTISQTTTFYAGGTLKSELGCSFEIYDRIPFEARVKPAPPMPTCSDQSRCGTGSVTFSAGGVPGAYYSWYNSAGTYITSGNNYTTPSLSSSTTFQVSATLNSCESAKRIVNATIHPLPVVDAGPSLYFFLSNSAATLTGGTPAGGSWSGPGVTGNSFNPSAAGTGNHTITYSYTDVYTCSNSDNRIVTVYSNPTSTIAGSQYIERGGSTSVSVSGTYDTYQWYLNGGIISGATNQTYLATKTGLYKALVTKNSASSFTNEVTIHSIIDQAFDLNYIVSHTLLAEGITDLAGIPDLTIDKIIEHIQYFDGLGRPIQTVTTQGSPQGFDIVQPIIYDRFGRDSIQYLPYVSSDQSGLFKSNAINLTNYTSSDQYGFYNTGSDKIVDDTKPYQLKLFEASPLNRVLEQGGPGEDWLLYDIGNPNNKTVKIGYETNIEEEVRLFRIEGNGIPATSNALVFDGTNDYVALNMFFNQQGRFAEITVEAWVNTTFIGSSYNDNWAILDFDRSEFFDLYIRGDNGKVEFSTYSTSGGVNDFVGNTTVNDGKWHHIAAVYDGTDKIIYVDGQEDARIQNPHSGAGIGKNITRYGFIGDGSEATTFNGTRNNIYYKGKIGEIKFWDVSRSADEIKLDAYAMPSDQENGLLAWWRMDNGKGSNTLTDHSGNGKTGTLYNMDLNTCWLNESIFYYAPGMLSVNKRPTNMEMW